MEENRLTNSEAQDLIEKMGAIGWDVQQVYKSGGQGHTIMVKNTKTNDSGVFKYLKRVSERNAARFLREITFLADSGFNHPNIVKLLSHSVDEENLWYISQKGEIFKNFWEQVEQTYLDKPDKLIETALEIIKKILMGLNHLHSQNPPIVHRDVKPDNIIFIENEPILIDFGTVYLPEEERLTSIDDAVGNRRFSPDTMMYRIDHVTPWLDLFQLSQILIFMVSITPTKNWGRPLDWRYVRYPSGMSTRNLLALQALTGLCSDETIGPKTAHQMLELIDNLFYFDSSKPMDLSEKIQAAIKTAKEKHTAERAAVDKTYIERAMLIDSHSSVFKKYFYDLIESFDAYETLNNSDLTVSVDLLNLNIENWIERVKSDHQITSTEWNNFANIYFNAKSGVQTMFKVFVYFQTSYWKEGKNPFGFQIQTKEGPECVTLASDETGQLFTMKSHLTDEKTSIREMIQRSIEWLGQGDVWI